MGKWISAVAILGIVGAVLLAPQVFAALAPHPQLGRVGIFERVVFETSDSQNPLKVGLIAPAGWNRLDTDGDGKLVVANRAARLEVSLHGDVDNVEALLRSTLPSGAQLLPTEDLLLDTPFDARVVEYDLSAGDSPALSISLCPAEQRLDRLRSCLLVEAAYLPGSGAPEDEKAAADAKKALSRMLASVELVSGER
ncbi:MAG TPA: hypothetical protein PLQ19_01555 [Aeromicrobium sp.]|nr:hypothetical protein [Aeromicrobium sp.]